jgi:hypothetical protein
VAVAPLAPTATQCTGELQDTDQSALNVAALGVARTVQAGTGSGPVPGGPVRMQFPATAREP